MNIINLLLEIAQKITAYLGEFEAAGIITIIKDALAGFIG